MQSPRMMLRFRVGETELGLPALAVAEVIDAGRPVPIPRAPKHILGVVAVRSRALPLVALEALLALTRDGPPLSRALGEGRRAIVTSAGELCAGLLCDRLRGVHEVPDGALRSPAATVNPALAAVALGEMVDRERGLVVLLNPAALLEAARVH